MSTWSHVQCLYSLLARSKSAYPHNIPNVFGILKMRSSLYLSKFSIINDKKQYVFN